MRQEPPEIQDSPEREGLARGLDEPMGVLGLVVRVGSVALGERTAPGRDR